LFDITYRWILGSSGESIANWRRRFQ
jgi:hypothetical protein